MFVVSLLELSPLCLHMYPNVFRTHVEVGDVKQCPTINFYLGSMNYIEKSRKCIDYDKKKYHPYTWVKCLRYVVRYTRYNSDFSSLVTCK